MQIDQEKFETTLTERLTKLGWSRLDQEIFGKMVLEILRDCEANASAAAGDRSPEPCPQL